MLCTIGGWCRNVWACAKRARGRARRIAGRLGKITYLTVTGTAGLRIAFSAQQDIQAMRRVPRTTTAGRS